jgi:hypothetical protein
MIPLQNESTASQAETLDALEWISNDKKHAWLAVIVAAVKSPSEFPTFDSSVEIPKHLLLKGNKMTSADMPWVIDTVDTMLNVAYWTATDSSLGPTESKARTSHEALRTQLLDVQQTYMSTHATFPPPKEEKKLRKNLSARTTQVVQTISDSEEEEQDSKVGPNPPEASSRGRRTNPSANLRSTRPLQFLSTSSRKKK